ncbi:MAG TPA: flagellar motor protein [Bryobacteraceae bacterium]|nr:flagellar motor protein [Bryobacteraceae bacterium]
MVKKSTEEAAAGRDYTAFTGIAISIAAVAGGFVLERGNILDLASLHALVIVIGGTIGAMLIGTPKAALGTAFRQCLQAFRKTADQRQLIADSIVRYAAVVRRAGTVSIEAEAEATAPGLLRRGLFLVVDGVSAHEIRRQLEADAAAEEQKAEGAARVFEQAGGYAPTIGIIGAVVGLIQVMKQLGNPDEVGRGIAAAFVSTLYGVAFANLLLLPLAARIRSQVHAESRVRELIIEGVTAIAEGLSLHIVRSRLETYLTSKDATPADQGASGRPSAVTSMRRTA